LDLGIIFGGKSFEHEISIVSAITVSGKIEDINNFVFLDDSHRFYLIPKDKMNAKTFSSKAYAKEKELFPTQYGFESRGLFKASVKDITFINMVHGGDGEDGVLSSLFSFYNIEYIGPRTNASVLSCDKYITKMYAKELGVKVVDYVLLKREEKAVIPFDYPIIIKPLSLGSSIGVSIVKNEGELSYALDSAFEYDDQAIAEPFIDGVAEFNLAGSYSHGEWKLSFIEEPEKESFLDFDKKYLDFSRTKAASEAEVKQELAQNIVETFKKLYGTYFRGSMIRCDFFVIDNEVYLNEINPIPGSLAHYLYTDFKSVLSDTVSDLPTQRDIKVNYRYIEKIHATKGK
jgi:D-alanine-D-alanine ligase